jgi:hypothetical protein
MPAWLWQCYQPGAAQVIWFRERVGDTGKRMRKVIGSGNGAAASDRLVAVQDPRRGARRGGHETGMLISLGE